MNARSRGALGLLALIVVLTFVPAVSAQSYSRLQILLPGEEPAPGTTSGKLGTPEDQVVGAPFTVRVRACDDGWSLVTSVGHLVGLSVTDQTATIPSTLTLVGGEAYAQVTLHASGSFTFSVEDQTDPTIPVADSAGLAALVLQGFEFETINQKNQYAGVPWPITLSAVDPMGSVVSGFDGAVQLQQLTSLGEGRIEPAMVTMTHGTWSGEVTLYRADETNISRGNVNIYAQLPTDPTRNGTSDPFIIHPGSLARLQLVLPGETAAPGSETGLQGTPASQGSGDAFTVDVYATDEYWNPLPSGDVFRITSSDPSSNTPVDGSLVDGQAQAVVSLGSVGTHTLTVVDQSNGSILGMTTASIPVTSGAVDQFVVEPISGPVAAGEAVMVTIRAADTAGNTIPEYDGNGVLTANTGPGSIAPAGVDFSGGIWTGEVTFWGAGGAVQLTCADYSSPPHTGTSAPFEVLAGPYAGLQVLAPGELPAGGTEDGVTGTPDGQNAGSAFEIRVRAVDAYWNRVPGNGASVGLQSSDPNAALPETTSLVDGEATLSATLFAMGPQTLQAFDADAAGIESHVSAPIPVEPGPYARLVLVAPGQELAPGTEEGRSGTATDQSINFAFTVAVHATDAWGNPLGGIGDTVRLTAGDLLAELPADTPLVDGRADLVVRLATGGFQQLTASNISQPSILPSTTQVRAISSGLHLEATVEPSQVGAGEPFSLNVRVTNDAGAVIQEINSFVSVEVRNASSQEPGQGTLLNTSFQLLQGERTISETYTFAEDIVLVVTDDAGNAPAVTEVLSVVPGQPAAIQVSSEPSWVRGGRTSTIRARVIDAFENGVPEQPVSFSVIQGLGVIEGLDPATLEDGVAMATFTAPSEPEIGRILAVSGAVTGELEIEIALVDPNAAGGTVTNYPNPFHPGEQPTTIAYKLSDPASVRLRIFTLMGRLVLEQEFPAGTNGGMAGLNEFPWDGRNGEGEVVASGGYILLIEATGSGETLHVMRRKIGVVR